MNDTVSWLHLSDLHARHRDDWDRGEITAALIRDLTKLQQTQRFRPDFIFFTGDAAFGATSDEKLTDQYQFVRSVLEDVRKAFEPEVAKRNIYIVPGNHDVDRSEVTPDHTAWLRDSRRAIGEVLGALRDGGKQLRSWMERLASYRNFITSYGLLHLQPDDPHLIWSDAQEICGIRVGICGFNSAWSCATDGEKGKLWCGAEWQIAQLKQRMGPVGFSIALIHHPGNWFTEHEDPSAMRRLESEFSILLHGHEHQDWVRIGMDRHLILSAGACYDASWMQSGYSCGCLDLDRFTGSVTLRQWDRVGRGWIPRNIAHKTRDGVWSLPNLNWLNMRGSEQIPAVTEEGIALAHVEADESESVEEHYTRRFCKHVIDQNDVLELFGCDIPRELQRHQLSVAYVSLNLASEDEDEDAVPTAATASVIEDATTAEAQTVTGTGIEHVLDALDDAGRLMIRGPAGAGKTTLLRWSAIHAAQRVMAEDVHPQIRQTGSESTTAAAAKRRELPPGAWRQKVPFLVRLRDCPDGKLPAAAEFPRFIAKHLPSPPGNWMTDLLNVGGALIFFDGVDEIHRDVREQLAQEIEELIRTFPRCTYIVTTRPGAVARGWLERSSFKEARVEPMTRADREEFITKWYSSAALELKQRPRPGEDLGLTAARLKTELAERPDLGVLASNPLLCAMICALYRERQERLPESPAELSEALVQMLLHRRERETPGLQDAHFLVAWRALQYPQKRGLLAELAWHMVKTGDSSIEVDTATDIVANVLGSTPGRRREEAADVLQAVIERSGLLRPAGDNRVDFLHNTLKEYLAATRAVECQESEALIQHGDDAAWQPVVLFALAIAPEEFSSNVVHGLLAKPQQITRPKRRRSGPLTKQQRESLAQANARDFFLVRCRTASRRLDGKLSTAIDKLTTRLFPPVYMQDAEALAQLGPRVLQHAASRLLDPAWWTGQDTRTAARCLRLLRLIGGTTAAAAVAAIKKLPSHSSLLTGEWMIASTELAEASLAWPFSRSVVWADHTHISDLRPIVGCSGLKQLSIAGTKVVDLQPLSRFSTLTRLDISDTLVSDLRPLRKAVALTRLNISGSQVSDLRPIARLPGLQSITARRTHITDLQPIAQLRTLQELAVDFSNVQNLAPLSRASRLRSFTARRTPIETLDGLEGAGELGYLDLSGTLIRSLKPLRELSQLWYLNLGDTRLEDLRTISRLPSLQTLILDRTPTQDLKVLAQLPSLKRLDIDDTGVRDLAPLAAIKSLQILFMQGIPAIDLTPLVHLPALKQVVARASAVDSAQVAWFRHQRPRVLVMTD